MVSTEGLRSYQARYVNEHALDVAHYMMWEPRLGKTRAEVYALLRCIEAGSMRTLVIGPQKPLELAWTEELAAVGIRHVPLHRGPLRERAQIIRDLIDTPTSEHIVVTVNFEVLEQFLPCWACNHAYSTHQREGRAPQCGAKGVKGVDCACERYMSTPRSTALMRLSDLLEEWNPENIDVDEGHLIKSAGAQRSFCLRRLGRRAVRRRMLSGTPDPQGYIDLYAQYVFLEPSLFGTTKAGFLKEYADVNPFNHQIEGYKNVDALLAKAFSVASRERAKDYFGEVPETNIIRDLSWTRESREIYDELAHEHVVEMDGLSVDGTHKLTRLLRHLQLCAGFLADDVTKKVHFVNDAKIEAILDDLSEPLAADKFVVVSYTFTPGGEALYEAIGKRYGKETVVLVNGDTKNAADVLRLFDVKNLTDTPVRVLVLQERVGGVGISLARARYLFFHSWSMDAAIHDQMLKRIWHPGLPQFFTYFQMKNSADGFARKLVTDKHFRSIMQREGFDFAAALRGEYKPEVPQQLWTPA